MESIEVIKVLTRDSLEKMVRQGGSGYWVGDQKRLERMKYVICVRNGEAENPAGLNVGHGEAFLIGKVDGVEPAGGPRRMLIRISKFKRINVAGAWDGSQNPVRYMGLSDAINQFGPLDDDATWEDFPAPAVEPSTTKWSPGRLTIKQAKAGLALGYDVDESSIEITIRA